MINFTEFYDIDCYDEPKWARPLKMSQEAIAHEMKLIMDEEEAEERKRWGCDEEDE